MSQERSKEGGFVWAIKTGDLKSVQSYIEKEGFKVNEPDSSVQKRHPLHYAADMGQADIIKYLLSKGAKIDAKDAFGITPLLAAVYEGHSSAVAILLEKGANRNAKGPDGKTALEAAESDEIKKLLTSKK
eukprot:TRINITY_DN5398_c0_g1_i1.p1 TRINITY_DN5398_c0_g1~~TRINITY_DN5398_c0_g1_i1.p1  ORF type:complete len:130 (-),score=38.62 TRINITY_DN5398_c0_g1_i1:122-511(-)